MANIIVECAKYMMVLLVVVYTYQCFTVFTYEDGKEKRSIFRNQNRLMFLIHFMAYMGMYFKIQETKILIFYIAQVVLLWTIIMLYTRIYPKVSRLIVNNMCMLLTAGFIMITRLSYNKAVKQSIIVAFSIIVSLLVPVIIRKVKGLAELRWFYGITGIIALAAVVIIGQVSGGAKLGFEIAGFGIQPSEFVKILFVFFVAASFNEVTSFKRVAVTTMIAAMHVLILVASRDLGAALIIFVVYLVMLYVATGKLRYASAGIVAGAGASVLAYHLFSHVRVRVDIWKDPFATYDTGGYQIAQALFAIGTGGWFGTGLFQGEADTIPVADEDFIFAAISEEMGLIFGLCLILICLSCYIMFLNIALQLENRFYKLVALGLGTCYIFQTFLTIGGVTKFIPMTGVTLPLVSYGGSSVLSTLIMFAIIQGFYIFRADEEEKLERQRHLYEERKRQEQENRERRNRHHLVELERRSEHKAKNRSKKTKAKENR